MRGHLRDRQLNPTPTLPSNSHSAVFLEGVGVFFRESLDSATNGPECKLTKTDNFHASLSLLCDGSLMSKVF